MIELKNVTKHYKSKKGIQDISFTIEKGEVTGIFGANGSGKTTLLRLLLGLLQMQEGEVLLDGNPCVDHSNGMWGYCPEERCLSMSQRVYDVLMLIGKCKGMKAETIDERINSWLNHFDIRQHKQKRMKELSKGNQQLVQLCIAFLHEPEIVVLDEPFNGLDEQKVKVLIAYIREYAKGHTVIMTFHQMEWIPYLCDLCIYLENGKVSSIHVCVPKELEG